MGGFSFKDETFGLFAGGCCVVSSFFSFFSLFSVTVNGFSVGFVLFVGFVSSVDFLSEFIESSLIILESECFPFDLRMVAVDNISLSASEPCKCKKK